MIISTSSRKGRLVLCWGIALVFTLVMARFQRTTGPTYALSGEIKIGATSYPYTLDRSRALEASHPERWDLPVELIILDRAIVGTVLWKRYRFDEAFQGLPLQRHGDTLRAFLPHQPPSGKLEYQILLREIGNDDWMWRIPEERAAVMRFRGDVPWWAMLPHIILLFLGLCLAARAALAAAFGERFESLLIIVVCLFVAGGLLFGPIVQKYAFGTYWTGWPYGGDWTDNKTAIMVAAWLPALWFVKRRRERQARIWTVAAMVVTFAVYLIPHSIHGSELDYNSLNQAVSSVTGC